MVHPIKHILIADDDNDDIELFKMALSESCPEIELTSVSDGAELLTILKSIPPPDIIVLDINMPVVDGKRCLQITRSDDSFSSVSIIILSTSTSPIDIQHCLARGANKYYSKPHSLAGIRKVIHEICSN